MTVYANGASWTGSELVADVRRKARIPSGSLDFTTANLLREASAVITSFAGWAMSEAGEGRELFQRQYSSATALLDSQYGTDRELLLPPQALADTIDSVFWVNADKTKEIRLQLIDVYAQPVYDTPNSLGEPWGFSMLNHRIRLYPKPQNTGFVRVNYQRRHPELVEDSTANVATTAGIAVTQTDSIDFDTVADPSSAFAAEDYIDVINNAYPYTLFIADARIAAVTISGILIAWPSAIVTADMMEATRVVHSGQSPYVHLPLEFRSCLTEKVAEKVLREIGDKLAADQCGAAAELELQRVIQMLNPRTQSVRQKVKNPNSLMRTRRWARWGWGV